jgi:hypothetical protein
LPRSDFVKFFHFLFGFLGPVLLKLPIAQLFQHADVPVGLDERTAPRGDFRAQPGALRVEQLGPRCHDQGVAVGVEQLVDVDRARARRDLGPFPHLGFFRGQVVDLLPQEPVGLIGLRQRHAPPFPFGLPQLE